METLLVVNRKIYSIYSANNYNHCIKKEGYCFFSLGRDTLRFFGTQDGEIVIDFNIKVIYRCVNQIIDTLGYRLEQEEWNEVIILYNKKENQKENIINLVKICLK